MHLGDGTPILPCLQNRGGGIQCVLDHIVGTLAPERLLIGCECLVILVVFFIGVCEQTQHRSVRYIIWMTFHKSLDLGDYLIRFHPGVIGIDVRQSVLQVAGIQAIGIFAKIFRAGGHSFLVFVVQEMRQR